MSADDSHKPSSMASAAGERYPDQSQAGEGWTEGHRNFAGQNLHFLQIGLGNNTTFIQNIAGQLSEWSYNVDWLWQAASEWRWDIVRGVGVEPVGHLIHRHRPLLQWLPNVELVQAAVSDTEAEGMEMHVLTQQTQQHPLSQVDEHKKETLKYHFDLFNNMSSLGQLHPEISGNIAYWERECGVKLPFDVQETDVWSYSRLAKTLNFVGCEVLMIDAEGHDTRILKSLIKHCEEDPRAWPQVIQFETMGHCDQLKDHPGEWEMISLLEAAGYLLVGYSHKDSYLVSNARASSRRLQSWLCQWKCGDCNQSKRYPYVTTGKGWFCPSCVGIQRRRRR